MIKNNTIKRKKSENRTSWFNRFYIPLIMIFFYAPIVSLITFSFNAGKSLNRWEGFSFHWYGELFSNTAILESLGTTLLVAFLATIISTVLGTLGAIGLSRSKTWVQSIALNVNNLPVVNPDIVTAVALMVMFVSLRVQQGVITMLLAHIAFCTPYVVISVYPKVKAMDPNIIEAAQDLGARPFQAFYKVMLPELKPSIIAGSLLAFTMSFDDFIISYFTGGDAMNISMFLYNMKRRSPVINALSTLMILAIALLIIIGQSLKYFSKKRQIQTIS